MDQQERQGGGIHDVVVVVVGGGVGRHAQRDLGSGGCGICLDAPNASRVRKSRRWRTTAGLERDVLRVHPWSSSVAELVRSQGVQIVRVDLPIVAICS